MAEIQSSFFSKCLKRDVHFNAILPIDPWFPRPIRYPLKTAYLLNWYTGSCSSWAHRHALVRLSDMNNLAIIMPSGENHFYVDDMQREDMYGEFIGCELPEFCREAFPVLSGECEDTIIGGISMGGYGALRNGLKYNDVFGHIIAIAPAMIFDEFEDEHALPSIPGTTRGYFESVFGDLNTVTERDTDVFWLSEKMKAEGARFPSIYVACGRNDKLVFESRRFKQHLTDLGIAHTYEEAPGTHDELFFGPYLWAGFSTLDLDRPPILPNPLWVD